MTCATLTFPSYGRLQNTPRSTSHRTEGSSEMGRGCWCGLLRGAGPGRGRAMSLSHYRFSDLLSVLSHLGFVKVGNFGAKNYLPLALISKYILTPIGLSPSSFRTVVHKSDMRNYIIMETRQLFLERCQIKCTV